MTNRLSLAAFLLSLPLAMSPTDAQTDSALPQFETRVHREGEKSLPYRLLIPQDYDKSKSWPLIIWLHGSGERGADNKTPVRNLARTFLSDREKCPALVMVPQCPSDSSWLATGLNEPPKITEPSRMVVATIQDLQKEFNLDDRRVYLGGFSMGGCGAWDLLSRYPNLFAAAFPIAGPPGDRKGLAPLIKEVPIWVFHGDNDRIAPVEISRTIVTALKEAGSPVKYTEFRNGGHEFLQAVSDPEFMKWLFAQNRSTAPDFTPSKVPAEASLITKTLPQGTRDTWTGKIERTGHAVPRLPVDGVRYRLQAAEGAKPAVAALLTRLGKGEVTGTYQITGKVELRDQAWIHVETVEMVSP